METNEKTTKKNNKFNFKNGTIAVSLILATAGVSFAIFKSNDNNKLINKNKTEKVKLEDRLKDLRTTNEAKSKALKKQLEQEIKRHSRFVSQVNHYLRFNNKLVNELNNQFQQTKTYTNALNAYKVSEFEKTDKYKEQLEVYKVSEFEKSPEYTKALKTDYNKSKEITNLLANTQIKNVKLEATEAYKNAFKAWKGSDESKDKTTFKLTGEYNAVLKQYRLSKHENTNAYKGNLEAHKSEFNSGTEYTKALTTFKATKTDDKWKTAFIETDKSFNAFKATKTDDKWKTAFIEKDAYNNAFSKYFFSFEGKLKAQKTELEGKITQEALTTLLNKVFARKNFVLTPEQKNAIKNALNNDNAFKASIKGTDGQDGASGAPGKGAYELWTEQPGNEDKTLNQFLTSLKGQDGARGPQGLQGVKGTKGADGTQITGPQLLSKIKELKFDDGLKAKIVNAVKKELDEKATNAELTTALNQYLKKTNFINELYNVLSKTQNNNGKNSNEVIAVINQMVEKRLIKYVFEKLVKEFKGLSDIENNKHLNNTDGTKNSFYKLAEFLFETSAKANEKLNALLEGNTDDKQDKLAIWNTDTNKRIFGTLKGLKAEKGTDGKPKYKNLQKVVYFDNTWNINGNENLYEAPKADNTN